MHLLRPAPPTQLRVDGARERESTMHVSGDKVNLSEIFASIQGEGRYLGTPSLFLRTSGCNLRCEWRGTRCDTPHTSWEARRNLVTINGIQRQLTDLRARHPGIRHLVLTGGEPLLQRQLPPLVEMIKELGLFITLETNGTIATELRVDFVSLSPKLRSSVPADPLLATSHEAARIAPDALRFWVTHYDYQFKFVIQEASDEQEIAALLDSLHLDIPPHCVYLMPQGTTTAQLAEHGRICVDICLRRGWHFTPRAHIDIFGNQPGT